MKGAAAAVAAMAIAAAGWIDDRAAAHPVAAAVTQCLDLNHEGRGPHAGMVWVPPGTYAMGDSVYPEEGPQNSVRVAGFWMDRHEVTNAQFARFVDATHYVTQAERAVDPRAHPGLPPAMRKPGAMVFVMPQNIADLSDVSQWWHYVPGANWRHPAGPQSSIVGHDNFPVVEVTHADALAYAHWLGRVLPGEAEWEWAARGAESHARPDHEQPKNANTWQGLFPVINSGEDGFVGLAPSGCYAPNRLGLYDMIGNVWEWTASIFTPDHATAPGYTPPDDAVPQRPGEASYTIKGGSFLCAPNYCMRYRPGARAPQEADLAASHLGFRTILRAP